MATITKRNDSKGNVRYLLSIPRVRAEPIPKTFGAQFQMQRHSVVRAAFTALLSD